MVLPGYPRTMGLPIVRGRDFTERDDLTAPDVVIVNELLARQHFPGADAIGRRMTLDHPGPDARWRTVVGVVRNAVREDWVAAPDEEIYLPFLQSRSYLEGPQGRYLYLTMVARTAGDPAALAPALRSTVWSVDGDVSVSAVQTMEAVIARSTASPRFYLLLLGVFAAAALALAAVGIYGVMSYSVACRRNEIGIRMALGADRGEVVRMVVGEALAVAAAGAAAGVTAALALSRLMSGLLYGVAPTDPATFVAVSALLVLVALAASYGPARRATRVDPLAALRSE